jgi:hypothetical protein
MATPTPTPIIVQDGGPVDQGAPVTWQNTASAKVHVKGLAGVVPNGEFHVDPASPGKKGEKPGTILPNAPTGPHEYTVTDGDTQTNPVLTVNKSAPWPK